MPAVSIKRHRFACMSARIRSVQAYLLRSSIVVIVHNVVFAERRIVTDTLKQTTCRNEILTKKAIYLAYPQGTMGKRETLLLFNEQVASVG